VSEVESACSQLLSGFLSSIFANCGYDLLDFCADVNSYASPALALSCLFSHFSEISPMCRAQLEDLASDIGFPCAHDAESYCADKTDVSDVMQCLEGVSKDALVPSCALLVQGYGRCVDAPTQSPVSSSSSLPKPKPCWAPGGGGDGAGEETGGGAVVATSTRSPSSSPVLHPIQPSPVASPVNNGGGGGGEGGGGGGGGGGGENGDSAPADPPASGDSYNKNSVVHKAKWHSQHFLLLMLAFLGVLALFNTIWQRAAPVAGPFFHRMSALVVEATPALVQNLPPMPFSIFSRTAPRDDGYAPAPQEEGTNSRIGAGGDRAVEMSSTHGETVSV